MEGDAGDKLAQMGAALRVSTLEFLILFPLALWGAWVVFYRNKIQAIGVATLWVGLVLAVGVFLYVPGDELYLIAGFLLPAQVFILLFSAWGLECALTVKDSALRVKIEKRIIAALVLLLAILGGYRLSHDRQTDYTYDYDYALNDIKTVPKGGLYFCKGDAVVFPCWYFQWVEQKRSDLVVIGVDGIPMDWVRRNLALFHPGLKVPRTAQKVGVESIPTLAKWMVDQNKWRELYFSYNEGADNLLLGVKTLPYGLAEKGYFPEDQAAFDEGKATLCWSSLRLRHMKDEKFPVDGRTLDLIVKDYSVYRNSLGIFYEDMGDDAKTKMNSHPKVEDFLKVQNDYQQSLESYQWAAEWDPEEPKYAFNQGNANYHVGKIDEAIACYGRAVRLNPKYTVAYENWAIVAFQTGRYSEAEGLFKKVLELKPDDAQAQQGLERLKQLGQLK
jgi:hypothetical protein